ncbi:MAG TPA: CHAT domain-containing protein, partial [Thermoanaerobaculia bacterium]|nr:CHAT domain-containing protein [Thermoanaerobaculia bacterium]
GSAEEIGKKLYGAVFSGRVRGLLARAERSLRSWEGLRLRFRAGSPEVSEWPFETLYDKPSFLALRKERLIVRYQGQPEAVRSLWGPRPLRILVVVSIPESLDPLKAKEEWEKIQDALEPLVRKKKVEIERLDNPSPTELAAKLDGKAYHVLHFIGHGRFNPDDGGGVIFLKNPKGGALPYPGSRFAVLLADRPSIRLVVLNTCEGALEKGDSFSGVAQDLIRQKIPAVLAMQAKIPDNVAVLFSQWFYERLAKGRPIDRALRKVRYELFLAGAGKEADWAMPVLYLGAKNGRLFTWLPSWRLILALLLIVFTVTVILKVKPWKPHCPTPKSVDMEFVWIEPAPGSKISKPYCIGKFEVSRGEWEAVLGANSLPKGEEGDDLPAGVSYTNALKFIRKLNEREGKTVHRLPTDAEWEHAAMGTGNSQSGNCKSPDGYEGLAPVGTFRTNDWDLYDMVGNVWEWVEAPDATQKERIRRGGSWESAEATCNATARKSVSDRNWKDTGFRVLRELPK